MKYTSLREQKRFGGETLLWSSKSRNDDEIQRHELLRHCGMKNRKVESMMQELECDLGESHMTNDNSFLRQTLK